MFEEENGSSEAWYSGVEPVDVGNLEDVKEIRQVIPATKDVVFQITKAENSINKENTYRSINLSLRIVNGIGEEGKYKNKIVFARVCYYADPNAYTKDFFKTKQHLVQLKCLAHATGIDFSRIDGHKLEELVNTHDIKGDITVSKNKISGELGNEVRNFKALDPSELI